MYSPLGYVEVPQPHPFSVFPLSPLGYVYVVWSHCLPLQNVEIMFRIINADHLSLTIIRLSPSGSKVFPLKKAATCDILPEKKGPTLCPFGENYDIYGGRLLLPAERYY